MDLSVIIPTYGRPEKIAACVERLLPGRQTLEPSRYEVLVGFDGPDEAGERLLRQRMGEVGRRVGRPDLMSASAAGSSGAGGFGGVRIESCPREGYNSVRNRLLPHARGKILLSLNDDVLPSDVLLATHVDEHLRRVRDAKPPAVVVGCCPWVVHHPDRLIDRMIRETSMVFFYDQMDDRDAERDWGFRHAWGMNMSMPAGAVREAGGFTAFPFAYGYDDIELAFRLQERYAAPVLYRPRALAPHDHRYEPQAYLDRERQLGKSAWLFAKERPAFALALFGRDVTSPEEVEYSRQFVARERAAAERLKETFLSFSQMPAMLADVAAPMPAMGGGEGVGGSGGSGEIGRISRFMVRIAYEQHLLVKRWMWRTGLLEAAGE